MSTELGTRNRGRIARRQVGKYAGRRDPLAAAAPRTPAERGYADASLRDIALLALLSGDTAAADRLSADAVRMLPSLPAWTSKSAGQALSGG